MGLKSQDYSVLTGTFHDNYTVICQAPLELRVLLQLSASSATHPGDGTGRQQSRHRAANGLLLGRTKTQVYHTTCAAAILNVRTETTLSLAPETILTVDRWLNAKQNL